MLIMTILKIKAAYFLTLAILLMVGISDEDAEIIEMFFFFEGVSDGLAH